MPMIPIPPEVIAGAKDTQKSYGIPASVTIAQWALESGWGKSMSGKNNYGGITAKVKDAVFPFKPGTPLEPATLCWTHEQWQGKLVSCQRWFKDYSDVASFFLDHSRILGKANKYAAARAKLPNRTAFINAFAPIYATAPNYASALISTIKSQALDKYDV